MDCVFCKIVRKPGSPQVVRLEPLNPITDGHMLFIPRIHVDDAGDFPGVTGQVMEAACAYAKTLDTDYNIITSKGKHATQSIFHLHIHVVPRHEGDGLKLPWTDQQKGNQ